MTAPNYTVYDRPPFFPGNDRFNGHRNQSEPYRALGRPAVQQHNSESGNVPSNLYPSKGLHANVACQYSDTRYFARPETNRQAPNGQSVYPNSGRQDLAREVRVPNRRFEHLAGPSNPNTSLRPYSYSDCSFQRGVFDDPLQHFSTVLPMSYPTTSGMSGDLSLLSRDKSTEVTRMLAPNVSSQSINSCGDEHHTVYETQGVDGAEGNSLLTEILAPGNSDQQHVRVQPRSAWTMGQSNNRHSPFFKQTADAPPTSEGMDIPEYRYNSSGGNASGSSDENQGFCPWHFERRTESEDSDGFSAENPHEGIPVTTQPSHHLFHDSPVEDPGIEAEHDTRSPFVGSPNLENDPTRIAPTSMQGALDAQFYRSRQADPEPHPPERPGSASLSPSLESLICGIDRCEIQFTGKYRKGNCARHRRLCHGQRPVLIYCEEPGCSKMFKRTDARLKHYRNHHPMRAKAPLPRGKYPSSRDTT